MIFPLDKIRKQLAKQAKEGNEAILDEFTADDVKMWFPGGRREVKLPEAEPDTEPETGDNPPHPPTDKPTTAALAKFMGTDNVQRTYRDVTKDE